jgi:hypothetical protein
MNKTENCRLNMHLASEVKLDENESLFLTYSTYPPLKAAIHEGIIREQNLSKRKMYLESLSSTQKTTSRLLLSDADLDLSSKLMSFASIKGDELLYDAVKLTKTSIRLLSDSLLLQKTEILIGAAEDNLAELTAYDVTEETIAAHTVLYTNFRTEVQNMESAIEELSQVTSLLTQQIKLTEKAFKKVDTIVKSMSKSQPDFCEIYWIARSMKHSGGSKISVKVKVFDAETYQPLPGAMMSVCKIDNSKALATGPELVKTVKVKSAGGGVDLKSLTTGAYLFTVSYAGCTDQQTTVYVNEGILTRVDFPLSKIA